MNKFQDMLAFMKVAELGGFTSAAKALSSSTSSISKSVTRLEEQLGVQLLHRTTRRIHLTEYGSEYYERSRQILADLDDAESAIRGANFAPRGMVRLALPPSFARMTVIPALAAFYDKNPNVVLDLCIKGQTANPIEGGYDLIVHSGRLADSLLVNRILVRGSQKTVASRDYLERYGVPQTPSDLTGHNCIVGAFGPTWYFRDSEGHEETVRVSGTLTTDSGDILREAALQGLGVVQATWWLFREDLRQGRLVPMLEDHEVEVDPISIVFPANRRTPTKVRAVVDFLLKITRDRDDAAP